MQKETSRAGMPKSWWTRIPPYGLAFVISWLALSVWALPGPLHSKPLILFLAAVVGVARFLGTGPAIFCTVISSLLLDFVVFDPHFTFSVARDDVERLFTFIAIAALVGGMARQKSRAEIVAEQALRRMASLVEDSTDAIISINSEGVIESWNRGATTLYGYESEEAIGQDISLITPKSHREEYLRDRDALSRGEHPDSYRTERLTKSGQVVPILLSVSPLRNQGGDMIGLSTTTRDISAQRRAEEALLRNEKLATAGRLAASVAHEINNPLEALTNLLYLAQHDPTKADKYLAMAETEVGRIAHIAQQTLGLVRDKAEAAPLNVAALMDEVLQLFSRKLESKQIRVARSYGPAIRVTGYEGELRQLFSNLIANAIDAVSTGGTVKVRMVQTQEWSDGFRCGVRVTIADNGSGIAAENREQVFEPFFTTKKDQGTGLGLWVSHEIVQKHGGAMRLRSWTTPGKSGTVFMIFLPEKATVRESSVA